MPSTYTTYKLKSYPEYIEGLIQAKKIPLLINTSQEDGKGVMLWSLERPMYSEWPVLIFWSILLSSPLALFLMRAHLIQHKFGLKEALLVQGE